MTTEHIRGPVEGTIQVVEPANKIERWGPVLREAVEEAAERARNADPANTVRTYQSSWRQFEEWVTRNGGEVMPAHPAVVAAFASHLYNLGRKRSTIEKAMASISAAHIEAGYPPPTHTKPVRRTMKWIRQETSLFQTQKAPLLPADLERLVEVLPRTLEGLRDRAVLLLGFAGGFRRSELVALTVADLDWHDDYVRVAIRKSKGDRSSQGRVMELPIMPDEPLCAATAVHRWLDRTGIESGAIFRAVVKGRGMPTRGMSDRMVALIVKRAAEAAGMDHTQYSGHSLRAGFVTAAFQAGVPDAEIMMVTGHKTVEMVRRYVRLAQGAEAAPVRRILLARLT